MFSVFVGSSTFFLLKFSASLTDPSKKWVTITNGFLYDILVSIGTTCTTLIFLQFLIPDETQKKWLHILREGRREDAMNRAEEEARVYFSQLSLAWKL
ncbi:hypothetical protein CAEBREN_31347 [Caenorhabditis brenneri]|uniref:Uncharacterized protein n=1 Tax=Caenorhabditis brenneri TaxID=135651 RepID=G0NH03_CAEBE|nr:hypothetical protein CAEBREN_31347 [Caenorhabditis brenneri]